MKTLFVLLIGLLALQTHAEGTRGGGDLCEDRIKIIRDDIQSWIGSGGPNTLKLPQNISLALYSSSMMSEAYVAKIRCVGSNDPGYPVNIDGTPKVCRFDKSTETHQITCDFAKFQSMNESDQYVLIHHEYAGLAGLEIPNGDDSNYQISNQISGYLMDVVMKKLTIKPSAPVPISCVPAQQLKTVTVKDAAARTILEALSAAGFPILNDDGSEWGNKILEIKTTALTCKYSAINPDEWMTNVECRMGCAESQMPVLPQSLAIAKAIQNDSAGDAASGTRWLSVDAIDCTLNHGTGAYACTIKYNGIE